MQLLNTRPTAEDMVGLIRELASLYIGHADQLQVRVQESTDGNSAYFMMKGEPEDDSRLVGSQGCHVNALRFLIEQAGSAQGKEFTSRLLTTPESSAPWYPPKDAMDYDPRPCRDLLCRLLAALGVENFTVEVSPGVGPRKSLSFNYDVKIPDRKIAEALTEDRPFVVKEPKNGEEALIIQLTVIGALGTLYRAVAKQVGVRFQIRLADRI